MIANIILLFIAMTATGYVVWPLFRSRTDDLADRMPEEAGEGTTAELMDQRDLVIQALKDLEMDRAMGKLSEEDYQELDRKYRLDARRILARLGSDEKG